MKALIRLKSHGLVTTIKDFIVKVSLCESMDIHVYILYCINTYIYCTSVEFSSQVQKTRGALRMANEGKKQQQRHQLQAHFTRTKNHSM